MRLIGFPRHLSQHVGGFVITKGISMRCRSANAAMDDRTFVEWDKDDLDRLGMLKIDVLALGMLTCIRKAFDLDGEALRSSAEDLASVPKEDPRVYDMLCKADTVGVFQVESRAQMSMLPSLKPRDFYDLVIEVAIVRPGPIQGDMVHPYLRRRNGEEEVTYPLGGTGRSARQDQGRAAVSGTGHEDCHRGGRVHTVVRGGPVAPVAWRRSASMGTISDLHAASWSTAWSPTATSLNSPSAAFKQIEGFGSYGFPESHAASFALLVYVSSWLKCHPGCVLRRDPQQSADGVLCPRAACPRCPRAWR